MKPNQQKWADARRELSEAVAEAGYPEELTALMVRQLKSPPAMDRMAAYLRRARPRSMEMIVDEMLAICADAEAWRVRKESQAAQAGYSAWLNSETRWQNLDAEDE